MVASIGKTGVLGKLTQMWDTPSPMGRGLLSDFRAGVLQAGLCITKYLTRLRVSAINTV
jgi:hypothetical protein